MGSLVRSLKSRDDAGDAVSYFSDTTLPIKQCQSCVSYVRLLWGVCLLLCCPCAAFVLEWALLSITLTAAATFRASCDLRLALDQIV
jgi:hypothetical protein